MCSLASFLKLGWGMLEGKRTDLFFNFHFSQAFGPAVCSREASPDPGDLEVWPILLQFAVVRVHGEKLSNENKHKKRENF